MSVERNTTLSYANLFVLISQMRPRLSALQDCRQKFQGGSFFDHEGLPYCETHYHAKRGSLCAGCHKPITGANNTPLEALDPPRILTDDTDVSFSLYRSLHNGDVPQIPSRALCMRVLPEAAEQGHVQRAERQALLPRLLREALRINSSSLLNYGL